MILCFNDSCVD